MFDKYSLEISKIFKCAEEEMLSLHHPYVGSVHLLLSLLKNSTTISNIAKKYDLTYESFRKELILVVGSSSKKSTYILYTPLLKRIINLSLDEANEKKEELNALHLLKALLEEGEGIAIRLLYGMDINLEKLYDELKDNTKKNNKKLEILNIGKDLMDSTDMDEQVIGRDKEISLIIETLIRKNKNNPLLVGDAGVGKTAIVEELVRRIKRKEVPALIQNKKIISLEMGSLVAGTKYRGEFEEKLNKVIKELENNPDIILFIDEIHTIVNAGGAEGAINASDILKPYLARGKIKIIGATTTNEYNRFILKDKALTRRFELIRVLEPKIPETIDILNKIKKSFEKHYNIKISKDNIKDIVELSNKYILDRNNPDKSLDILDSVCAMKEVDSYTINKIADLRKEKENIIKEKETMVKENDFKKALYFHNKELEIEDKINKINNKSGRITKTDIMNLLLKKYNIPKLDFNNLDKYLNKNIIGQEEAIAKIVSLIKSHNSGKPLSLLITGSTGVGKTQTIKLISKYLSIPLLKLDMSEYNSDISITRLIGSPSGYIGYDDGSLFDKIKMEPFTCILVDEIEKASPKVLNLFLQILDEGIITNAKGEPINFKNTFIFATSNIKGTKKIGFMETKINYNQDFSKELLARFSDIIEYKDITIDDINTYLKMHNITDINIDNFDYRHQGFRGLDKYIEDIKKAKVQENV
mgnify:FL=1